MPLPQPFTIPRHCVPRGPDRLSPLQHLILHDEAPVRVFSAPTGAGKSYAFRRAVAEARRVMFVVPTRRLAQNLSRALIEELVEAGEAPDETSAARRVVLWTSDERERLRQEQPELRVGHLRVRQFVGLEEACGAGDMIIATPESVGYFLLRSSRKDTGDAGFSKLFTHFDHIVFDEFHTIEARGFGLAAACALVASQLPGGPKVSFLSATPVRIRPVLERLGVEPGKIADGQEEVITGPASETGDARALHGDVRVEMSDESSLAACLRSRLDEARRVLAERRQVVLVYDSLAELQGEKRCLAALCDELGVGLDERLAINSADDSARDAADDGLFTLGARQNPLRFRVLVATSSIEVGVTFKAGLMLMEPGYASAGFVQRLGRAARGDEAGTVVVRLAPAVLLQRPWLRPLLAGLDEEASAHPAREVRIDRLIDRAMVASYRPTWNHPPRIASH